MKDAGGRGRAIAAVLHIYTVTCWVKDAMFVVQEVLKSELCLTSRCNSVFGWPRVIQLSAFGNNCSHVFTRILEPALKETSLHGPMLISCARSRPVEGTCPSARIMSQIFSFRSCNPTSAALRVATSATGQLSRSISTSPRAFVSVPSQRHFNNFLFNFSADWAAGSMRHSYAYTYT